MLPVVIFRAVPKETNSPCPMDRIKISWKLLEKGSGSTSSVTAAQTEEGRFRGSREALTFTLLLMSR